MRRYNNSGPPLSFLNWSSLLTASSGMSPWSRNFRSVTWNRTAVTDTSCPSSPLLLLHQINSRLFPQGCSNLQCVRGGPSKDAPCGYNILLLILLILLLYFILAFIYSWFSRSYWVDSAVTCLFVLATGCCSFFTFFFYSECTINSCETVAVFPTPLELCKTEILQ